MEVLDTGLYRMPLEGRQASVLYLGSE